MYINININNNAKKQCHILIRFKQTICFIYKVIFLFIC